MIRIGNNQNLYFLRHFFKDLLEPLSYLVYFIALVICVRKVKEGKMVVLLVYYFTVSVLLAIAAYTPSDSLNKLIYNLFFFFTICVFSFYFNTLLFKTLYKRIVLLLFTINSIVFIYHNFLQKHAYEVNTFVYAVSFLTVVIFSLLYFIQLLQNIREDNIFRQFDFWLVSSYLLYFLSSFFIILFYVNIDINERALLWSMQNIVLFLSSLVTISGSIWISYHRH